MSDAQIRFHVGAHKTATTYIQETLLLNRAASAAAGVAYWPMHNVRANLRPLLREVRSGNVPSRKRFAPSKVHPQDADWRPVEQLFRPDMQITISEENILGNPEDMYAGHVYPRAGAGLSLLKRLVPDRPLQVFVCIRAYAPFIASIYAESLRHGNFTPWEKVAKAFRKSSGEWPNLIDTIRSALPKADVVVWRYEDFHVLEDEIMATLSGLASADIRKPASQDVLPSASGKAIEEMMTAAPELGRVDRIFKMLELTANFPRETFPERFAPWDADAVAALDEAYESDVAGLRARSDIRFLG